MRIIIVYQRYLDEAGRMSYIGGLNKYVQQLCALALESGLEILLLQFSQSGFDRYMDEAERFRIVGVRQKHKNWTKDLVAAAERLGEPENDLLIFATSTQIVKHPFRRALAIQHGVYWDVPTIHGKKPPFPLDVALRAVQAYCIIRQHKQVTEMICVDYNYVNWLRAVTVDRSLRACVIPNFTECPPAAAHPEGAGVRLIFARRFEDIRGVYLIMEFLPRLLRDYPELHITLAGNGCLEDALRQRFGSFDRVRFASYTASEAVSFHRGFDIAIVPSIGSEGTSLSLLEAMAAGCAVVCSNVGGMSNIVLDGYNGRILPPSADAFERAIRSLIEDPAQRRALAERGRQTAASAFSLERWQRQWREVLARFASGHEG